MTALVVRSGGPWVCIPEVKEGFPCLLSVVPFGLDLHSERLLFVPYIYMSIGENSLLVDYRVFDLFSVCAVCRLGVVWGSNHRLAAPFAV